jgi:hypothetical protein
MLTSSSTLTDHHDFKQNSFAVNPEGSWFEFASTDAAILHATLSIVALNYDLSHHLAISNEVFYHKGEAIRLVNRTINNTISAPIDKLVGAVAILANCEVCLLKLKNCMRMKTINFSDFLLDNVWIFGIFNCSHEWFGETCQNARRCKCF